MGLTQKDIINAMLKLNRIQKKLSCTEHLPS